MSRCLLSQVECSECPLGSENCDMVLEVADAEEEKKTGDAEINRLITKIRSLEMELMQAKQSSSAQPQFVSRYQVYGTTSTTGWI